MLIKKELTVCIQNIVIKKGKLSMTTKTEKETYTLEIDCPPGLPRPGDLLQHVLEGTGVVLDSSATTSRLFGCWTWNIPEEYESAYLEHRELIKDRLEKLYNEGTIRYASW